MSLGHHAPPDASCQQVRASPRGWSWQPPGGEWGPWVRTSLGGTLWRGRAMGSIRPARCGVLAPDGHAGGARHVLGLQQVGGTAGCVRACPSVQHPSLPRPSGEFQHPRLERGGKKLLMSLERLPWEPVANESLGFLLPLQSGAALPKTTCFPLIRLPWQRLSLIPSHAPGFLAWPHLHKAVS